MMLLKVQNILIGTLKRFLSSLGTLPEETADTFYWNIAWQYLSSFMVLGFRFLNSIIIAKVLGVSNYGLIALAFGFVSVAYQFMDLRLNETVIKYVAHFREQKDRRRTLATVKLSLLCDCLSGAIAYVILLAVSHWAQQNFIRDPRGFLVISLVGLDLLFSNIFTATAIGVLRSFGMFKAMAIISTIGSIATFLVTAVFLLILHMGLITVLIISLGSSFIINAVLLFTSLRTLHKEISLFSRDARLGLLKSYFGEMIRFAWNMYLFSLSSIPIKELDVIILGWFTSKEVVGLFKMAKNFMSAIWTICDPVFLVIYPELSKLWAQKNYRALRRLIFHLTKIMGIGGLILFAAAVITVPILITTLLGGEFHASSSMFLAMVWSVLFWAPLIWVNPLLFAAGRPSLSLCASTLNSLTVIILYLVFIPLGGGLAAAFVYGIHTPLVMSLALWLAWKDGVISFLWEKETCEN
jgi:O-antigen/teichoic acid export membrane protein